MLIFDGGCGFCRRTLRWGYAVGGRFEAVPSTEVDPVPLGLSRAALDEAAWWVAEDGSLHRGHHAVARVLESSRWLPVRLLGRLVGSRALSPVGERAYAWVAENRSRFPG